MGRQDFEDEGRSVEERGRGCNGSIDDNLKGRDEDGK